MLIRLSPRSSREDNDRADGVEPWTGRELNALGPETTAEYYHGYVNYHLVMSWLREAKIAMFHTRERNNKFQKDFVLALDQPSFLRLLLVSMHVNSFDSCWQPLTSLP